MTGEDPREGSGRGLRELDENLWVSDRPLRFGGIEVGTRMTAIRLGGGELWLHSPVELDQDLRSSLDKLGRVRWVVAPNRFHHLWAGGVLEAYPDAQLFLAPGLAEKRPDLAPTGTLGDETPAAWEGQVDQLLFRGFPLANEVVFLHRASRSLILSDLAFNVGSEDPFSVRLAIRLLGGGRFGPTLLERLLIRDRPAARACLERILEWDFDRVIVAHGHVLDSGGRQALRDGYRWLLSGAS
jgi:hypothetical protein